MKKRERKVKPFYEKYNFSVLARHDESSMNSTTHEWGIQEMETSIMGTY